MMKCKAWALAFYLFVIPMSGQAYNEYAPNIFDEVDPRLPVVTTVTQWLDEGKGSQADKERIHAARLSRLEFAQIVLRLEKQQAWSLKEREVFAEIAREFSREYASLGVRQKEKKEKTIKIEIDPRVDLPKRRQQS